MIPHYDPDTLREFTPEQRLEYWREIARETREWLPKSYRRYFTDWLRHPDHDSLLTLYQDGSEARRAVVQFFLTEFGLISPHIKHTPK